MGFVGKNLMFHPWAQVIGYVDEQMDGHRGPPLCLWSQEFYETDRSRGFVRGFNFQFIPHHRHRHRGGAMRTPMVCCPGARATTMSSAAMVGHRMHVGICTEDLPEEHNRVTLDPVLKDGHGIPAPKIDYTIGENTNRMLDFAIDRGKEILAAAGARQVHVVRPVVYGGWHLLGTARMGNDPERVGGECVGAQP